MAMKTYKIELNDPVRVKLEEVAASKEYKNEGKTKWKEIVDCIIKVLDNLDDCAGHSEDPNIREQDSKESIEKSKEKIVRYLKKRFYQDPPFTVVRLAELLVDPESQGYSFGNALQISKFFNSVSKLVLVSSSFYDYPSNCSGGVKANGWQGEEKDTKSANFNVVTLPLVEIPWLKGSEKGRADDAEKATNEGDSGAENRNLDPMIVSPPFRNGEIEVGSNKTHLEIAQSPTRRRKSGVAHEAGEMVEEYKQTAKKARKSEHNASEKRELENEEDGLVVDTSIKERASTIDDDVDEKMDISNSTMEEVFLHYDGKDSALASPNKADVSVSEEKMDISAERIES